jgi:hypothetical protein
MEPDPLSGLSAEERLELLMLLLDERHAREPVDERHAREPGSVSWTGPDNAREYLEHIFEKLGVTPELIHEIADELHVDLALILDRVGYGHGDE